VAYFRRPGPRTRRLTAYLKRRASARSGDWHALDARARAALFRARGIVFTDTADFTVRVSRDGILHFLMLFDRAVPALERVVRRAGGRIVKVEADSLLLLFEDASAACEGVEAVEAGLARLNRGRPENQRLRFSYGIGYGEVLDLEGDVFGLEVNLASKLGEDTARPGDALLTPGAVEALDARTRRRVSSWGTARFGPTVVGVHKLELRRR
jgi:class 3 adenylate cyclase